MDHSEIFADKLERYIAHCVPILDQFKFQGRIVEFREWFKEKVHKDHLILNDHHFYTVAEYLKIDSSDSLFIDLEHQIFSDTQSFDLSSKMVEAILKAVELHIFVLRQNLEFASVLDNQIELLQDIESQLGKRTKMDDLVEIPLKKSLLQKILRKS